MFKMILHQAFLFHELNPLLMKFKVRILLTYANVNHNRKFFNSASHINEGIIQDKIIEVRKVRSRIQLILHACLQNIFQLTCRRCRTAATCTTCRRT
jgi:hypothetical protein